MQVAFSSAYASIEDLSRDTPEVGEIIQDKGLPLDTIGLIDGRVAIVSQIDYEGGISIPLVRRFYGWSELLKCILPEYRDVLQHETQNLVVCRDGTRHFWSSKMWI
jgi:hypothetical protein